MAGPDTGDSMVAGRRTFSSAGDRDSWPGHTGNWGRWDNDRGTLNLVDEAAVLRGTLAVRLGKSFALGRPLQALTGSTMWDFPAAENRLLVPTVDTYEEHLLTQVSHDLLTTLTHGQSNSHIDALGHMGHRHRSFNGQPFDELLTGGGGHGLNGLDITLVDTIVTRAHFLDVARLRGVDRLTGSEVVSARDIEPIADAIQPGDAVVIRTGVDWQAVLQSVHGGTGTIERGAWPGLDCSAIDLLATLDVVTVASDTATDSFPHEHAEFLHAPVHTLAEVYYGIPLVHNLDLEALATAAANLDRPAGLLTVAPLRVRGGTGSLVSPVFVL